MAASSLSGSGKGKPDILPATVRPPCPALPVGRRRHLQPGSPSCSEEWPSQLPTAAEARCFCPKDGKNPTGKPLCSLDLASLLLCPGQALQTPSKESQLQMWSPWFPNLASIVQKTNSFPTTALVCRSGLSTTAKVAFMTLADGEVVGIGLTRCLKLSLCKRS